MKTHPKPLTPQAIKACKNTDKLVCLTAYSASVAGLIAPHCDIILVGDSLGMTVYGLKTTQDVTLDMMICHGKAVRTGAPDAFIVVDMPYGTYDDVHNALNTARTILSKTHCDAVKIEGGVNKSDIIKTLIDNNITVMGHIGLLPQSVDKNGSYRIQGKNGDEVEILINDAHAVEQAGAFCVVLEGIIEPIAREITNVLSIPTIGIGASAACDGQILVTDDIIGLSGDNVPKFVKHYARVDRDIYNAVADYASDVRSGAFPTDKHTYD